MGNQPVKPEYGKTTVAEISGLRAKGATGWHKTWVGMKLEDGTYYAALFDDGKDFVPETFRISKDEYDKMMYTAMEDGWTEVMTHEEIRAVSGAKVGDVG